MCVTKPVRFRTTTPTFRRGGRATRSPSRRATLPLCRFCPQRGLRPVPPGTVRTGFLPTQMPQGRDGARASELTGPSSAGAHRLGPFRRGFVRRGQLWRGDRPDCDLPAKLPRARPASESGPGRNEAPGTRETAESGGATAGLSRQSPGGGGAHTSLPRPAPCPPGTPLQARAGRLSPARAPAPGRA